MRVQYFQLDEYQEPCQPECCGLALLETYTSKDGVVLPAFLNIEKEVTDDSYYSMFNLCKISEEDE